MSLHPTRHDASVSAAPDAAALPGPPTDRELAILWRVLGSLEEDGVAQLLEQVRMVQVDPSSDPTCRIYLLHPEAPRSTFAAAGRAKLCSIPVRSPQGRVIGEVAVWVEQGHLRALQFVRVDAQAALVLPPPEWLELSAPELTGPARVAGGLQALAGLRAVGVAPVRTLDTVIVAPEPAPGRRSRLWTVLALLLALGVVVLAVTAFQVARADGADVDAARTAGAAAGTDAGIADGFVAGRFTGATEGAIAGRNSTYGPSLTAARARTLAAARRAAQERRRAADAAAAAAAAPAATTFVDNTSCSGYRAANGNWICS